MRALDLGELMRKTLWAEGLAVQGTETRTNVGHQPRNIKVDGLADERVRRCEDGVKRRG